MTTNTNVEKTETQNKPTYRAPRLVALGSTVELVQGGCTKGSFDGTGGYRC
jgi:hypothetical protein